MALSYSGPNLERSSCVRFFWPYLTYIHSATPIARMTATMAITMAGVRVVRLMLRYSSSCNTVGSRESSCLQNSADVGPMSPQVVERSGSWIAAILYVQTDGDAVREA